MAADLSFVVLGVVVLAAVVAVLWRKMSGRVTRRGFIEQRLAAAASRYPSGVLSDDEHAAVLDAAVDEWESS